ncbi:MAG: hypothetical protein QXK96_00555 [Candidatus Bathyarchaeia archaeon]
MIQHRTLTILLTIIVAQCFLTIQLGNLAASAQAPPYPPLSPSLFNVVKTAWVSANQTVYAAPGDTNIPLYVTVQNIGNRTATGLRQTLFLEQPFTNVTGGKLVTAYYEKNVDPGLTATTKFILNISRNASIGIHMLRMQIRYLQVVSGVGATLYLNQQSDVEFPVFITGTTYMAVYSINLFPKEVTPGGNVTVSGTIVDTATSTVSNTNISVHSPAFIKGAFIYVGQADPNIPRPFSMTLQVRKDIPAGSYPIDLTVAYKDSFSVDHVSSASASLTIIPRTSAPSERMPTRSLVDTLMDLLWSVFRFLFGSSTRLTVEG